MEESQHRLRPGFAAISFFLPDGHDRRITATTATGPVFMVIMVLMVIMEFMMIMPAMTTAMPIYPIRDAPLSSLSP